MPKYVARLEQSKNAREEDFLNKIDESINDETIKKSLKEKLKSLSYKNTLVYQDLFILENIFREYIKIKEISESDFNKSEKDEKDIIDDIELMKNRRQEDEERHALKGKIVNEEHYLNYADLSGLAGIIDIKIHNIKDKKRKNQKGIDGDAKEINPVRNPVMHTNEITDEVMNWDKIKNVIDYIERLKDKKK